MLIEHIHRYTDIHTLQYYCHSLIKCGLFQTSFIHIQPSNPCDLRILLNMVKDVVKLRFLRERCYCGSRGWILHMKTCILDNKETVLGQTNTKKPLLGWRQRWEQFHYKSRNGNNKGNRQKSKISPRIFEGNTALLTP